MNVLLPFSELKTCLTFYPEDTRSTFLRKVDKYPADCTLLHPRRLTILLLVTCMRSSNQAQIVQPPATLFLSTVVQFCSHLHCVHPGILELPSCYRVVGYQRFSASHCVCRQGGRWWWCAYDTQFDAHIPDYTMS
jgi:hypothetical protein